MLEELLGRSVEVSPCAPWAPIGAEIGTIAVFVDDSLVVRSVGLCDLPFSAYAGAAIGLLPADVATSTVVNAAAMELGAVVCTARAPRCAECPLASTCAWRAAGFPDTGDDRRRQARYEGSDRQARGAVMKMLRDASAHAVPLDDVIADWHDPRQRDRAIDSLIADGLAEASDGLLALPR